jgi:hypothetical protein
MSTFMPAATEYKIKAKYSNTIQFINRKSIREDVNYNMQIIFNWAF